jgi:hypothetical protein
VPLSFFWQVLIRHSSRRCPTTKVETPGGGKLRPHRTSLAAAAQSPGLGSFAGGVGKGGRSFSSDMIGWGPDLGFKPLKLQGLKAPSTVRAIVGPEGPSPFAESASLNWDAAWGSTLRCVPRGV